MSTYQHLFISRYSRISSILEMDTLVAQHVHRQAFSTTELASAKSRLRQLQQFQTQVDNTWRSMRWLMDVLNFAREKHSPGGLLLHQILMDRADSPCGSPPHSPQHSQSLHTLQVPGLLREPPTISIRIAGSTSSFSLTESPEPVRPASEIRRCASTSGLVSISVDAESSYSENKPPSSLHLSTMTTTADHSGAYSTETLSVTYKMGSSCGAYDDDASAAEGIVINVTPGAGSNQSLSTNPDIDDLEDDISDYKEQEMDDLLQLPHEDSKDQPSDDEEDSLTDCGLQFKAIPGGDAPDDDVAFVTNILDTDEPSADDECAVDELKVGVSYCEFGSSVRLTLHPDATAREIVEAVVQQVNDAAMGDEANGDETFVDEKNVDGLCLVVSFESAERFLSDSFQPLKVQNPWTKGKLSVRHRTDACTPMSEP